MCTGKPPVGGIISKQDLQDLEEFLAGSFANDHPIFHTPPASPCMDRGLSPAWDPSSHLRGEEDDAHNLDGWHI